MKSFSRTNHMHHIYIHTWGSTTDFMNTSVFREKIFKEYFHIWNREVDGLERDFLIRSIMTDITK